MGTSTDQSTRDVILDKAEALFAEHGIHAVSVRRILAESGVNAALAHYHFGGREGLIREVLRRRIEPLNRERLELLAEVVAAASPEPPALESVLRAFFAPLVDLLDRRRSFARLVGELHVTADPQLKAFFGTLFHEVVIQFAAQVREALPRGLPGTRRLARAHFVTGVMVLTLTSYEDMEALSQGRYDSPRGEELLEEMIAFCAAGLTAPAQDGR
jgi:AcrR family transcriptional regulator